MAEITLRGNPIHTVGDLPPVGQSAPSFSLTKSDLSEAGNADFSGKRLVLNIFPSVFDHVSIATRQPADGVPG